MRYALIGMDTVWVIGMDREATIAEARGLLRFTDHEWEALAADGRTGDPRDEGTFRIVECSNEFFDHVVRHGGTNFAWCEVDGVLQLRRA